MDSLAEIVVENPVKSTRLDFDWLWLRLLRGLVWEVILALRSLPKYWNSNSRILLNFTNSKSLVLNGIIRRFQRIHFQLFKEKYSKLAQLFNGNYSNLPTSQGISFQTPKFWRLLGLRKNTEKFTRDFSVWNIAYVPISTEFWQLFRFKGSIFRISTNLERRRRRRHRGTKDKRRISNIKERTLLIQRVEMRIRVVAWCVFLHHRICRQKCTREHGSEDLWNFD